MDGNNKSQPTGNPSQFSPQSRADNPPSLTEPTVMQRPPADLSTPAVDLPAPLAAVEQPALPVQQTPEQPVAAEPNEPTEPTGGLFRNDEAADNDNSASYDDSEPGTPSLDMKPAANIVSWTSSGEDLQGYSASWRYKLSFAGLIGGGLVYLITRDVFPSVAVAIAGLTFGFIGSRTPSAISYQIDQHSITVGQKRYSYNDFRSFSVTEDGMPAVILAPLRRFMPPIAILLDTLQTDDIIGLLSQHLPMEAHKRDPLDQLVNKFKI